MNYLKIFSYFLTPTFKEKLSKAVLYVAIISFLGHLGLYILHQYVWGGPADKLFSAEGIFAQLLILIGVAFGVGMYYISQKFQKLQTKV